MKRIVTARAAPNAMQRIIVFAISGLLVLFGWTHAANAEEPFQVEVNILSATVMAGTQPIGQVARETKLTAYQFNGTHYLVDLPNSNPPQQGWIAKDDVHRVVDDVADFKRRLAADPPEQQQQLRAKWNEVGTLENAYNELYRQGKLKDSLSVGKQLADGYAELFGPKSRTTADTFNKLGIVAEAIGDYAAARMYYEQALAIYREVYGEKHANTAWMLSDLGYAAFDMGDYAAARQFHEQALAIRRNVFGEKHPEVASSLQSLGNVAEKIGDYADARKYFEQALAIQREVLGEKHADTAGLLNNLGLVAMDMGDYDAARKYYKQALAIKREVLGEKHASTATSLENLGVLALRTGDDSAAQKYFEQSLAICREVYGEKHSQTAHTLTNLGAVAEDLGEYAAARNYLDQALAIRREVLGEKHPDTADTLSQLGEVADDLHEFAFARQYHEQALAIRRQVFGEKHPDTAVSLYNLGIVAFHICDYPAARKYLDQALAIQKAVFGEKHPNTSGTLHFLGIVARAVGNYAAAREYHAQSLAIDREVLGDEHPQTIMSRASLAETEAAEGQWEEAADTMQEARRIVRRHVARVLPFLSAKEQLEFLRHTDGWAFYRSLSLGFTQRSDGRLVASAAGWLLNGKAVAIDALSEQTRLAREATSPEAADLMKRLLTVRGMLATLSQKAPPPNQREVFQRQLAELESEEQQLSRQLAGLGADVKQADPWVSLDDVRRKLPADSLLIDIARFDVANFQAKGKESPWQPARYAAWVIPPAGKGEIEIIDLGEADKIEAAVKQARASLDATAQAIRSQTQGEDKAEEDLQKPLRQLAALVLDPLVAKAGDAKRLILSPDGALWLVPFAALPLDDGRYAVEKYQIDYVVSGRDLLSQHSSSPQKLSAPLVFANPDFDLSPQEQLAETRALLPTLQDQPARSALETVAMRSADSFTRGGRVQRLPGTAEEAQAIAPSLKRYAQTEPRLFLDKQALEGLFKAAKSPRVVVLSTHGFFLPDQEAKHDDRQELTGEHRAAALTTEGRPLENPLLRCGLLLAGCNHRDEVTTDDDGVLTGLEIVGTDLRGTELVVFSACQTGLGDVHNGQGVAGLRQAFQLAGAQAVVSTLWSIPDDETVQLMSDFFANLSAGQSKADALRNAQLSLIKSRRATTGGSAHPYFWAAFTLTGQ